MLHQVLDLFQITPDIDLDLHTPGQTLQDVTARALTGLAPVMREIEPAAVVVQGDTATTFAAALAAFYDRRPVIHLEAGLRTGDLANPFPEEANRRLTTRLASLHLCATPANRDSLLLEGVLASAIAVTGNTVIDSLLTASTWNRPWSEPRLHADMGQSRVRGDRMTVLVTAHRRESWGEPLRHVAQAIADVARQRPEVQFVWPLHANPAVHNWVRPFTDAQPNVVLTGPLPYQDFVRLMTIADVAVTDSGGVQEEAPALGIPVLVTRDVTERHEAIACGAAALVGTSRDTLVQALTVLLDDPDRRAAMTLNASPYGDGHAADRSTAAIAALLGVGKGLPDFVPNYDLTFDSASNDSSLV